MSGSSRAFVGAIAAAGLWCALVGAASAAIESTSNQVADLRAAPAGKGAPPAAATSPAAAAPAASATDATRSRPGSRNVLRCWQFGRLIYEGQGVMSADKQAATMRVAGGGSVHLLDMQSATCILEQAGG